MSGNRTFRLREDADAIAPGLPRIGPTSFTSRHGEDAVIHYASRHQMTHCFTTSDILRCRLMERPWPGWHGGPENRVQAKHTGDLFGGSPEPSLGVQYH
jgi:hypothetical protein